MKKARKKKRKTKEKKIWIDRQRKIGKARERYKKPRNACQGEDQTNSTEINRHHHVAPYACPAEDPILFFTDNVLIKC